MLRRLALITAAALLLTACGQPDQTPETEIPAQVVTTTSPTPKPAPTTTATKAPKPKTTKKPRPKATTTKAEAEDVYYANCAAVRAAGAAPIRKGDPGYSRKLDRDGDGVACES